MKPKVKGFFSATVSALLTDSFVSAIEDMLSVLLLIM